MQKAYIALMDKQEKARHQALLDMFAKMEGTWEDGETKCIVINKMYIEKHQRLP